MTNQTISHRRTLWWYATTIFLSSAILLVLEITAGRLIAPYVGVTIYSWTSIIGVVLAGLSLGNWVGGEWADRSANEASIAIVLTLSGIFSLFSLFALSQVAPLLQNSELNLISSSFLYVLSMFFIPSVLLGIPTPLLTTLALKLDMRTGHIVGRMHALAALGSIIGTFITGFVLIQYIGSRNIIIACALFLFALALPYFRGVHKSVSATLVALTIAVTLFTELAQGFRNPCEHESNYFCLRVVDMSEEAPHGTAKALILDHLVHGINHESDASMLISPYLQLMHQLVLNHFDSSQWSQLEYFFAGGGAYTMPRAVKAFTPEAKVTVAELDPLVTRVASEQLYLLPESMDIVHGDARRELWRIQKRFDVVVTDAFHDIAIPYHLVTQEFSQLIKSRLTDHGIYLTNVIDAFPDPKLVKSMVKTLQQEFDQVNVWIDQIPQQPQRLTFVISASNQEITDEVMISSIGLQRRWFRINAPLFSTGTAMNDIPVFTDDYVPVERMISGMLWGSQGL